MGKKLGAIFIVSVTGIAVALVSLHMRANAAGLSWFNQTMDPELNLVEQNVSVPSSSYWGIPCTKIPPHKLFYRHSGTLIDQTQSETCAQYTGYGYFTGSNELMLAGTDTSYKIWSPTGVVALSGFITPLPDSNDVIVFNNSYLRVYRDLPKNIEPVYDTAVTRLGKINYYRLKNAPNLPENQIRYADGSAFQDIKEGGFSFAKTGGKLLVNIGPHQAIVDTNTLTARRFGKNSYQFGTSTTMTTSLNSDGTVALTNSTQPRIHTLYDLENCVETQVGKPEACPEWDYGKFIREKYGINDPIVRASFITDEKIELFIEKSVEGKKQIGRYLLKIAGSNDFKMQYLALGDSFASGEGAYDYKEDTDTDTNRCHLSRFSYPYLIKNTQDLSITESVACSGAKIKDIYEDTDTPYEDQDPQSKGKDEAFHDLEIFTNFLPGYRRQHLFVKEKQPEATTVSIGGNDIDFGKKLRRCILTPNDCYNSETDRQSILKEIKQEFTLLTETYGELKRANPGSRIYAVGYPNLAKPDGNCAVNVRLSAQELQLAEDIVADLNGILRLAAQKSGVSFVDTTDAFNGHRLCEDESWNLAVNGITAGGDNPFPGFGPIGNETYHPNKLGHTLYKQAILSQTDYLSKPLPAPDDSVGTHQLQSRLVPNGLADDSSVARPILEDGISGDIMKEGDSTVSNLAVSGYFLKPGAMYQVEVRSTPVQIGTATAFNMQELSIDAALPNDLGPGAHTIHILGQNINGEPIDIYKNILVIASDKDYDGDGIANAEDACHFVEPSGLDSDEDGIDDACDPFIEKPSVNINTPLTEGLQESDEYPSLPAASGRPDSGAALQQKFTEEAKREATVSIESAQTVGSGIGESPNADPDILGVSKIANTPRGMGAVSNEASNAKQIHESGDDLSWLLYLFLLGGGLLGGLGLLRGWQKMR